MEPSVKDAFQTAIVRSMGCDPKLRDTAGVSVAGAETRAESHVTSGYVVGAHLYITCDPAAEAMLKSKCHDLEPSLEAWSAKGASLGGELVGGGIMQVPGAAGLHAPGLFAGYRLESLDVAASTARIEQFIQENSKDDLDEAELEIDDLDEIVEVVVDADDQIVSWASTRPFDMAEDFGDIGVITHPGHRGKGLGAAAVASLCERMPAGTTPLYRCDADNVGSVALSASLGFERATELIAFRFPTPEG